jgi:DUF4097 and DUF4098 domain-containing protein YvlB
MLIVVLAALLGLQQTDRTVPIQPGTRLEVENFAGEVNIEVWERDDVRVRVEHSERETVELEEADRTLRVRGRSSGASPRSFDYDLTIPAWMAVAVSGQYTDVYLQGVGAEVSVAVTRGDVDVEGGSGHISLKAVQGEITLRRAKGRVEVMSVNGAVRLSDVAGEITAQATNGSIVLDRIDSTNIDLYTVNGRVSYDGPIRDGGAYRLVTHNGSIGLTVREDANATIRIRTYNGDFESTFPVRVEGERDRRRGRFTLRLGTGSAGVELESFNGSIRIRRPGEAERDRGRATRPAPRPRPEPRARGRQGPALP